MPIFTNGKLQLGEIPPQSRVFAYLVAQANTTVTEAGTYYPILGTFTNDPIDGFATVADPAIKYTNNITRCFEIDWHTSLSADDNGRTVHCAIKKNDILVAPSIEGTFLKVAGEPQALSGTVALELEKDDTIQLVLTSSVNLDVITVYHFTTTIRTFQ
jgi:hypothetical protein